MKPFTSLTEREILALAISSEEEDGRIYADFAEGLREQYPDSARVFDDMAEEESEHRRMLINSYVDHFGNHIPLVRRQDVKGAVVRKPAWQVRQLGIDAIRKHARQMEVDASRFYSEAAARSTDAGIRKLLGDLADRRDRAPARRRHHRRPSACPAKRSTEEDDERPPPLRPADHPAGPRRPDGRLGLHPRARLRRRVRHPAEPRRLPGRHRRLGRRRHLDGFRRGARRRRQALRPRHARAARRSSAGS